MADSVRLSFWLRGFTEHNMLSLYERVLRRFPYSRLAPAGMLRIFALDYSEPPVLEEEFDDAANTSAILSIIREHFHNDCAFQLDCCWDLWHYGEDWSLKPCAVSLAIFGPFFESPWGEQVQIDLGLDFLYLPSPGVPPNPRALRSNIRSVLHLAEDMQRILPVDKRALWSESGENLAERLQEAVEEEGD
ncbi:MAG: hypothetical protein J0L64_01810 [Acidobacteria bacterium]|nr:hypothetical protein [Acidobacteriota bacterium]